VLEHLNFFNKVISELLVDVKIDEEDKVLKCLNSLPQSYDHNVTTVFYCTETLILEVMLTILSSVIRKRPNQEKQTRSGLVVTGRKERGEGKKVRAR